MTTAQQILKMIESVDPSDTAKLDEIDARVWCYLVGKEYQLAEFLFSSEIGLMQQTHYMGKFEQKTFKPYTSSRDALKKIRPNEWKFDIIQMSKQKKCEFMCWLHKEDKEFQSVFLLTEELAELHAIIQAIEYERTGK
jgi:hypothetical protein